MRYYDLTLSTVATANTPSKVVKRWTSYPNGKYDSGAQNIEFDMFVMPFTSTAGNSTITIEGVSLNDLQQAQQFTGLDMVLKAGMGAGLPLNTPTQAGIIATGRVWQSWGNWQGTEMTLDMVITPSEYYVDNPGNIILNWKKGTTLQSALTSCLTVAYPDVQLVFNGGAGLSANLVADQDIIGNYASIQELSYPIYDKSAHLGYPVNIVYQAGKFSIFDSTYAPKPIQINFVDLVGQPTWIDVNIMQLKVIMRADIAVGAQILMPKGFQSAPGLVTTSGQALPSSVKYKSAFEGAFNVIELRQLGNFRAADGQSWVTVMNCAVANPNG